MVLFPPTFYFFKSQTSYHTYKIISSYELARPIMGTIFWGASEASETLGLFNRESRIYIACYTSKSGIWLVIARVALYFHEPKASANTA